MLVYFSFSLIGCEYFRIKSMIVNDGDPALVFFSSWYSFIWYNLCLYVKCILHVECVKWWPPSYLFISDRVMVECACVCVSSQTCYATRGMYLHIRNVKSMCICIFCSESNCLLKSRYVSSNPLRYYHQSVCVTTRELTYSLWTCQTAWFYSTFFKHSLRRLSDLSLSFLFFRSVCLSVLSWLTFVQVE